MAKKNEQGEWINPRGKAIHWKFVKPLDRKRDQIVERCAKKVERLHNQMAKVKSELFDILKNYELYVAEKYEVEPNKGGNLRLSNFTGDLQIERSVHDIRQFNELLDTAKTIIDECLVRWSDGANSNLITVVDQAFQVNQKGTLNHQAILDLRKLNIQDDQWQRAMELVNEAYVVVRSSTYILARVRDENGKMKTINLNFSTL